MHGWFFRVRVTVLSSILAVVSLWACYDVRDRAARNDWVTPLRVGLVIVQHGNVDPHALARLHRRTKALEQRLTDELRRYRPDARPLFELVPYGPVQIAEVPPYDPGSTVWERVRHSYELWRYTTAADSAANVPTRSLDSRIYIVAEPPQDGQESFVEGFSEERGRVGVTRVTLDCESVDLALFVAAHELMHTLGASDKYDSTGRTRAPVGLPEPDQTPLYPQRTAEVMARNRVLSESLEVPPTRLSELSVGRWTAREIGWVR